MVLPVLKNFSVGKGVGFDYRWQWNQGAPSSSVPTNLTLYNASLVIANFNASVTYLTLTNGVGQGRSGIFYGGSTGDPTNGIIDIIIIGTDTAAFTFQNARYTLAMIPIANPSQPVWLLYGAFSVIGALA